jgi:PilZ domain-containing protein
MSEATPGHEDILQDAAEQPVEVLDQPMHRRAERRFCVDRKAEIQVNRTAALFRGRIVDLSHSGCYIQTIASTCLPLDTAVEISFVLTGKAVRVSALSKRSKSRVGMGFRFVDLSEETRKLLKQFIKGLAGSAEDVSDGDPG